MMHSSIVNTILYLEREGVEHIDIFGSVARGDARPDSDVDVIVTPYATENSRRLHSALEYAVRAF
ncbi:MAG: nucleotidyltransferase domain-containing protein [Candidatus Aquilonibacter sp.]|jgi:predicted nucleotidyltransferase